MFDIKDTQRDLLDPAINGATTILEAAARYGAGSVRCVVTTASFASNLDLLAGKRPSYTYTEQDWNPMTCDEATTADPTAAYCASKALAERAQWDWMSANAPAFETPEAGGERFILAHHFDYQSVADAVRGSIPGLSHRIPAGTPGAGWQALENGAVYSIDTSKAQRVLGIKYTPIRCEHEGLFSRVARG